MDGTNAGTAFRRLLTQPDLLVLAGCYDAWSAILLEQAGFPAVFVSGYGVAATLGVPDIGLTTLSETIAVARRVVASVSVPVVLDIDNGYGDEDGVVRAIREAESAGVAAVQLEDQVMPKRCGHMPNKKVHELDHALRKLEFALDARETDLCIIARTDSSDIDDAITRARAFHDAGADCTIVDGLRSLADMQRVAEEVPGPKQLNLILGGKTPILSNAEVARMGFKIALYSTPALYLATQAMLDGLKTLRAAEDLNAIAQDSVGFGRFQELIEGHHTARRPRPRVRASVHAPRFSEARNKKSA